jgi:hypothetical protein
VGQVSMATKAESVEAIGDQYRASSRAERTKGLEEFARRRAITRSTRSGCCGRRSAIALRFSGASIDGMGRRYSRR